MSSRVTDVRQAGYYVFDARTCSAEVTVYFRTTSSREQLLEAALARVGEPTTAVNETNKKSIASTDLLEI